jgi:hypothetical protein
MVHIPNRVIAVVHATVTHALSFVPVSPKYGLRFVVSTTCESSLLIARSSLIARKEKGGEREEDSNEAYFKFCGMGSYI